MSLAGGSSAGSSGRERGRAACPLPTLPENTCPPTALPQRGAEPPKPHFSIEEASPAFSCILQGWGGAGGGGGVRGSVLFPRAGYRPGGSRRAAACPRPWPRERLSGGVREHTALFWLML